MLAWMAGYDPFSRGAFAVGVRTTSAADVRRGLTFPCELWYPTGPERAVLAGRPAEVRDAPAAPGRHPLVVFSHYSGGGRRTASYLTTHLASHGYLVAAVDHSELIAPELAPTDGETAAGRASRIEAIIGSRVPDVRFLLSYLIDQQGGPELPGIAVDEDLIAVAGHSLGGWTALAVPEQEPLVRAVVALAPGGSSRPVPGVLPLRLGFGWEREIPVLILAGDCDVPIPLDGVQELYQRAPAPKRMFVLRGADHGHFADDVEANHEALRAATLSGDAAWMTAAMRPIAELCSGDLAHQFTCVLTVAHLDSELRGHPAARDFLDHHAVHALQARGVPAAAAG